MTKKKTSEEYKKEVSVINPDIDVLGYTGSKSIVKCKCKIDGYEWECRADTILLGRKCAMCENNIKRNIFDFYSFMKSHNPNIELLSEYTNNYTPIKCRCKIDGHEWAGNPSNFYEGSKCPKCSGKMKMSSQDYKEKLAIINSNIEVIDDYIGANIRIRMRCKIHNYIWKTNPSKILQGCGCPICNSSKGELKIKKYFDDNKINYLKELRFKDCRDKRPLPFDFYLSDYNCCIEYDGEQHFKATAIKKVSPMYADEIYKRTIEHDMIKNKYCETNNIKLIRIPYWEFNNIEYILERELVL